LNSYGQILDAIYKGYPVSNMQPSISNANNVMSSFPMPNAQNSPHAIKTKLTWHRIITKLLSILPAAFFFPVAVAVAVLSPPPIVTVPMTSMPVPLGANERISPPTVTRPPEVRVCPAMTRDVTGGGIMDAVSVMNVEGSAPFTITAFPVGEREITCPPTVKTPPGVRVSVPITRSDCIFSVNVDEPTTKIGADVIEAAAVMGPELDGNGSVMTSPPDVMAEPGKSVWLSITKPDAEFAVMLEPWTTTTAEAAVELAVPEEPDSVTPLTMIAPPEFMDTTSPLIVAADPGVKVWEPITKSEDGPWLTFREPMRIGGVVIILLCAVVAVGMSASVLVPITMVTPFEAMENVVPPTVTLPPGVKVAEPITKSDAEFAVIVELPMVTTAWVPVDWKLLPPSDADTPLAELDVGGGTWIPVPDGEWLEAGGGTWIPVPDGGLLEAGGGTWTLDPDGKSPGTGGGTLLCGGGAELLWVTGLVVETPGLEVGCFEVVKGTVIGSLVAMLWDPIVKTVVEGCWKPIVEVGGDRPVVGICIPIVVVPRAELEEQGIKPPIQPIIPPIPVDVELEVAEVVGGWDSWVRDEEGVLVVTTFEELFTAALDIRFEVIVWGMLITPSLDEKSKLGDAPDGEGLVVVGSGSETTVTA
jgi:hypothetical protein